jgi:Uma2 family endonuclease
MTTRSAVKLTYEDYAALPADGKRYEIIDGELYVNPSPVLRHQLIQTELIRILASYVKVHRNGILLSAPTDVLLGPGVVVQPDILFIQQSRLAAIVTDKNIQGPPDLVIEVLSEGNRRYDEFIKRRVYDNAGVGEYWIVDHEIDMIKIDRRGETGFVRGAELSADKNGILESPLFPTLPINLRELFATP